LDLTVSNQVDGDLFGCGYLMLKEEPGGGRCDVFLLGFALELAPT
jgi:hypothetical protein